MCIKWSFFTETGKVGSGKNPKSGSFVLGLKYVQLFVEFLSWPDISGIVKSRVSTRVTNSKNMSKGHITKYRIVAISNARY